MLLARVLPKAGTTTTTTTPSTVCACTGARSAPALAVDNLEGGIPDLAGAVDTLALIQYAPIGGRPAGSR